MQYDWLIHFICTVWIYILNIIWTLQHDAMWLWWFILKVHVNIGAASAILLFCFLSHWISDHHDAPRSQTWRENVSKWEIWSDFITHKRECTNDLTCCKYDLSHCAHRWASTYMFEFLRLHEHISAWSQQPTAREDSTAPAVLRERFCDRTRLLRWWRWTWHVQEKVSKFHVYWSLLFINNDTVYFPNNLVTLLILIQRTIHQHPTLSRIWTHCKKLCYNDLKNRKHLVLALCYALVQVIAVQILRRHDYHSTTERNKNTILLTCSRFRCTL